MAIGGGGGGGLVGVANSFTGAAGGLDIYGDFAAAYSGKIQIATGSVDQLSFTSGNYLFVGDIICFAGMKSDSPAVGEVSIFDISFNSVPIFTIKCDATNEEMPSEVSIPLLIPAYTEILVTAASGSSTSNFVTSVNVIGRIYRE